MSYFSRFSPVLTSYDFVKLFAVVTMIIDHIGFYCYPDELWFRVVGRLSLPCWMFLIGYARTREIPKSFIIGGLLIEGANIAFSHYIMPVTLFVTFTLVRTTLDNIARAMFRSIEATIGFLSLFLVLSFPTSLSFEYGTLAFMIALFGYAVKHKEEIKLGKFFVPLFSTSIVAIYIFMEALFFGMFAWSYFLSLTVGLSVVSFGLYHFKPQEYPVLTSRIPSFPKWILQFCGRYSLEIYVAHLILFIAVSKLIRQDFTWFNPTLFPEL